MSYTEISADFHKLSQVFTYTKKICWSESEYIKIVVSTHPLIDDSTYINMYYLLNNFIEKGGSLLCMLVSVHGVSQIKVSTETYTHPHSPLLWWLLLQMRVRYEQLFRYAIYIAIYVATDDDPTSYITSFTFML